MDFFLRGGKLMSIKSDFKDYQTNRKQYLKINLPKKISKTVNIFSLVVLLLTLIPICLYLINAFKIFNVYRLSFILTLIIAICIFLLRSEERRVGKECRL